MRAIIATIIRVLTSIAAVILTGSCSLFILESSLSPDNYLPDTILIIIDNELYPSIKSQIEIYRADISKEGIASAVELFDPLSGSSELRGLILSYDGRAESGFFIGDIPPAWYEQTAFGKYEVFPSDLYYMDPDSIWTDSDGNGFYDTHTELEVDFYVSRVDGSAEEINFYFDKLHNYRNISGATPVYNGAFIFKDDDWQNNYRNDDFGLKTIYNRVDIYQDSGNTTRSAYSSRLSEGGAEYVYQWIHAFPPALFVDSGSGYEVIRADDIGSSNFRGNFYNLFDCQAARFTVKNLASSYITGTDSSIAVVGSTKTGGIYYPIDFHKALGLGACWGAAYMNWYNTQGRSDDEWFLGMIIMGDPAIRPYNTAGADLSSGGRSLSAVIPISDEDRDEMYRNLRDFTPPEDITPELLEEIIRSISDY